MSLILERGNYFTLIRCNGNSHIHQNVLEKKKLERRFHIHFATERYIQAGKPKDGFAKETTEYKTLEEAYQYLLKKCNIADRFLDKGFFGIDIWK